MAEDKKDKKKEESKSGGFGFEEVLLLIFGLITIFFVTIPRLNKNPQELQSNTENKSIKTEISNFYNILVNEHKVDDSIIEPSLIDQTKFRVTDIIKSIFYIFIVIAIFLSLLFWILKNFFVFKLKVIKEEYNKIVAFNNNDTEKTLDSENINHVPDTNGIRNPKWEMIESYAKSGNQAELRLAIIEADIMLFDVLKQSGFPGSTIGEVLKNTNKSQLATLDYAWRAHRVRNELAHQGSNFVLGRQDAEMALDGYKKVFDELNLI